MVTDLSGRSTIASRTSAGLKRRFAAFKKNPFRAMLPGGAFMPIPGFRGDGELMGKGKAKKAIKRFSTGAAKLIQDTLVSPVSIPMPGGGSLNLTPGDAATMTQEVATVKKSKLPLYIGIGGAALVAMFLLKKKR